MNLKVPRIYNNMQSLGYRKYQPQILRGTLKVTYQPDGGTTIEVLGLVNKTHAVNGIPITYVCYDYPYEGHSPMVVVVGSNKTGKFETGAM